LKTPLKEGTELKNFIISFFIIGLFCPTLGSPLWADTLRWGADSESGAPYAFRDPKNPELLIGFEVDLVKALAQEMGLEPQHVQNKWEGLVEGLKRKDYDLVVNGLEITEERKHEVGFSVPYYVTYQQLTVRKTSFDINSLDDLIGHKVGTLDGSLALKILQEKSGIEALAYDQEIHAYNDLTMGRIDAVLLDAPIALYYAGPNPKLKSVGKPIGRMEYGIAVRPKDSVRLNEIDLALKKLIVDGTLKKIFENWALWNSVIAESWGQDSKIKTPPTAFENYLESTGQKRSWIDKAQQYISFLPLLGKGALLTLKVSIASMILAILIGLGVALMRLYGPKPFSILALSFVEVFRGTPLLIQLYLIFYGLPHFGIKLDPFFAAVVGLGLNYGACEAENYRAGILSVPRHQMDAALALGMSRFQALRHIILPQAVRLVIPPVTNDFIALLKDSSLVSVITMVELTTIYGQLASTYFDYLGIGILAAAVYFVIGLPFVRLSRYFESQMAGDRSRLAKVKS